MSSFTSLLAMGMFDGQVLGPVILGLGFLMIPVIGILTRHQRKMAEIIHGRGQEESLRGQMEEVKAEVAALRTQLRSLDQRTETSSAADELTRRLG